MIDLIAAFAWGAVLTACVFIFWPKRPLTGHECHTWARARTGAATEISPGVWECRHDCCHTTDLIEADDIGELLSKNWDHECEKS